MIQTALRSESVVNLSETQVTTVILNDTDTPDLNLGGSEVELISQSPTTQLIINSPGFGAGGISNPSGNSYFPGGWS